MNTRLVAAKAWLIVRNDLRLRFRQGKWSVFVSWGLLGGVILLAHAITIPLSLSMSQPALGTEASFWFFLTLMTLGASMIQATITLYEKSDFDLLLSSPVPQAAVLLARLASLLAGGFLATLWIALPLIDGAVIGFGARYVGAYATYLLTTILAGAAGIGATLLLVRLLGARRAKTATQIVGILLGAVIYLAFQMPNMLGREHRAAGLRLVARATHNSGALFAAEAGRGELLPLVALAGLTAFVVVFVVWRLSRTFVGGVQEASSARARFRTRRDSRHRWSSGFARAAFMKDLRLIVRDPLLLAQVLPATIYTLPMLFPLYQTMRLAILAPAGVVTAGLFTRVLTAVSASGEECWDLIRMSPNPEMGMRLAKLLAGMAIPVTVALAMSLAVALDGHPGVALVAVVTALVCSGAIGWLQVSQVTPSARRDLMRRQGRGVNLPGLGSTLLAIAGAVGVGLIGNGLNLAGAIVLGVVGVAAALVFATVRLREVIFPEQA